jgi:peptide/nickel transport system substrate-binding protein
MMVRTWSNPMYFADPFGSFGVMWAPGGPSESEGRFNTDEAYAAAWERFRFSTTVEGPQGGLCRADGAVRGGPADAAAVSSLRILGDVQGYQLEAAAGHIPYVLDFRAGAISFATN